MEEGSDVITNKPSELSLQLLTEITDNFSQEQKLGSSAVGDLYKDLSTRVNIREEGSDVIPNKPSELSLQLPMEITDNFSQEQKLGSGAVGDLYKDLSLQVNIMEERSDVITNKPRELSYQLLTEITDNFSQEQKLGSGAFGDVYKGVLKDGVLNQVIAVKKLRFLVEIDDKQFANEYALLTRLKHQNIVQLVGFCNETEDVLHPYEGRMVHAVKIHRALCLEFVPNGNLGTFLSEQRLVLNWPLRFKIIKGICEGLKYLHDVPLNHLDLKPDNILLDDEMVPKIADFGISRLVGTENTVMTLTPLGTLGYIPPEFIKRQVISREFDIFSLGVIIKKIMTGVMDDSSIAFADDQECIEHVHNYWKKRLQVIPGYLSLEVDCKYVRTCIEIAVVCMNEDPRRRPTIKYIVRKLNKKEPKENDAFSPAEQFHDGQPILSESDIPESSSSEKGSDVGTDKTQESKPVSALPKELQLDFLNEITDNFSDARLFGEGPFGKLYKGILQGGETIAVRKFGEELPVLPDKAFDNEVSNLMALQHDNVVKLVGYCRVAQEKLVEQNGRFVVADTAICLLCYEYLPTGNLHQNLFGPNTMDWDTRFKIIKGICQGLLFLHRIPILHMDLKPNNILLDHNMVPKISDFYLSRLLGQEQTRLNTQTVVGSYGYIAPEFLYRGEVSTQSDIYSLGLVIIETATGEKFNKSKSEPSGRDYIQKVRLNWTEERIASSYSSLNEDSLEEVKACIQIGLECAEIERNKRPSIETIVESLHGRHHIRDTMLQTRSDSVMPLSVQPPQLCFPFQPKRSITCSFSLINTTDDRIAFKIVTENPRRYLTKLPFSGVVPPNCTYTLNVTMREQKQLPQSNNGEFLTLQSSTLREQELTNMKLDSVATEMADDGEEVKEVTLPVVCDPQEVASSNQPIQPAAEIIASQNYRQVLSVDVHPNKPWILTSNQRGNVCIWDYQKQAEVNFFEVSAEEPVYSATFIEREEWLVAGGGDGYIYVYSYDTMEEIESFQAHDGHHIRSLAASATHSFLLSASDDHKIKIWDWKNRWGCMRTFEGHGSSVTQLMFDPKDSTSFASASLDHTVKMWDIYSSTCNATLDRQPDGVLCLRYFTDEKNQQLLLSGCSGGAAKIWDLENECCVSVLGGDARSASALCWHPELRVLITGSLDGTIQIWKSTRTAYRLENIIGLNLGAVNAIGYVKGLKRIVVGCEQGIATMEIRLLQTSRAQRRWGLSTWWNVIGKRQ